MAKAPKKSTGGGKKAPAKKSASKPAASPAAPLIDTGLAAQAAARMLRAQQAGLISEGGGSSKESATFKQLKENVSKPHVGGLDHVLDSTTPASAMRSNQSMGNFKQVGHNQTFGADVARKNIPRRTSGG